MKKTLMCFNLSVALWLLPLAIFPFANLVIAAKWSPASIDHIDITPACLAVQPNNSRQVLAEAVDTSGRVVAGTFMWRSSKTSVAAVDDTGKVTGIAEGRAEITVTEKVSSKSNSYLSR